MSLPANGSAWPPPAHAKPLARMRDYDAWYAGDADRLATLYIGRGSRSAPQNRPSQYRGGIVGAIARTFWGAPTPQGEQRTKLHVPLPADIATASADLLFAKPPAFKFASTANSARWEELDDLLNLRARLHEAAEVCSPLGGVYLRAGWDLTAASHPLLSTVHADRAAPEFVWDRLKAVTFWRTLANDGQRVRRFVERHEMVDGRAVTLHGLYEGTLENLGRGIDLAADEATAGLEPVVDIGLPVLPVAYVPNMLPSRLDRGSNLGRSDFEGPILGIFDSIDETFTSWLRDIRLAKARIMVPSAYLTSLGPGQGAGFEAEREAYEALSIPPTQANAGITLQQFSIRVTEHEQSLDRFVRMAVESAGYSASTFGMDTSGGVQKTATEVTDSAGKTLLTREKKTSYWGDALQQLATAVLAIDRLVFGNRSVDVADPADIEWPPGAQVDGLKLAQTAQTLRAAEAASTETLVRMSHPEWDDARVGGEVMRILAERGTPASDPFAVLSEAAATGYVNAGADALLADTGQQQ